MKREIANPILAEMYLLWHNRSHSARWYHRLAHDGPTTPVQIGEAKTSEMWHAMYEEARADAREYARVYWFARKHPMAAQAIYDFGAGNARGGHRYF